MERAVFGWPRWTGDVTWSGGSWLAGYPLANLGVLPLARVARSTNDDLASTQVIGTFSATRSVRALALARHNLSLLSRLRLRLYGDAARTELLLDTGWFDTWPSLYLPGDLEWEDDNWWDGKPTAADIAGYAPTRPIWLGASYRVRAFHLEIDDTANAAGYVEAGLLEVAQGWQVSVNPGADFAEGFRFRTESVEALGGGKSFDRRDKPRTARGTIEDLPRDEAMARGFEMQRQADLDQPFLWFPQPEETQHWIRTAFVARLVDPGLIAHAGFNRSRFPFAIEEVL